MELHTIDFKRAYTRTERALGSNQGGFFMDAAGQEHYIKWLPASKARNIDRLRNEYLALKLYELFNVAAPKAELFTFIDEYGREQIAISTPKAQNIKQLSECQHDPSTFTQVCQNAQKDFLVDVLLANYDVVGLEMDNLHYDQDTLQPFRIDPGGALRYRAQGGDKWEKEGQFSDSANEFEAMESGEDSETAYNSDVLKQASKVFKGVYDSAAMQLGLNKLLSVSDEQIRDCVNANYYDTTSPEGVEANEKMIATLLARKQAVILKAEAKIALQMPFEEGVVASAESEIHDSLSAHEVLEHLEHYAISPKIAIQRFPDDEAIIMSAYHLDRTSIAQANPIIISELINKRTITPLDAINAFPTDPLIIKTAFKKNASIIDRLNDEQKSIAIVDMIEIETIEPEDAVGLYPDNDKIVLAAYQKNPAAIANANPNCVIKLLSEGLVSPEKIIGYFPMIIQYFPDNNQLIMAAYQSDPSVMNLAKPGNVLELMTQGLISPEEVANAFPMNESIQTILKGKDFLEFIRLGDISIKPTEAVANHPKNPLVVWAAYQQDPSSLKMADREVVNYMGYDDLFSSEKVAELFEVTIPSEGEINDMRANFYKDIQAHHWEEVRSVCDKLWFEKPHLAERSYVARYLARHKDWTALLEFEQSIKTEDHKVEFGPLRKSKETYELEALFRKMLTQADFEIKRVDDELVFEFDDGTSFNWDQIQPNANLQHIDLIAPDDMEAYSTFIYSGTRDVQAQCTLSSSDEKKAEYHAKLHTNPDPLNSVPLAQTYPPITFEEMQALNIYTGDFYGPMNGLMRNDLRPFNLKDPQESKIKLREALIHSVMAASGLRKLPITTIQTAYRGGSLDKEREHHALVRAAASKGVIELTGFVSSSKKDENPFMEKPVNYTFHQLRGAYIAPISQHPDEEEFLIPQTLVQINHYANNDGKISVDASIVDDVSFYRKMEQRSVASWETLLQPDNTSIQWSPSKRLNEIFAGTSSYQEPQPSVVTESETVYTLDSNSTYSDDNYGGVQAENEAFEIDTESETLYTLDSNSTYSDGDFGVVPPESDSYEMDDEAYSSTVDYHMIDLKLHKIQNRYQRTHEPPEALIKDLLNQVCKISNERSTEGQFSTETERARYVISKIKDNITLCHACQLNPEQTEHEKIAELKALMHKAATEESLFSSPSPTLKGGM